MRLLLLGINHRTAPVELREALAINAERLPAVLAAFRDRFGSSNTNGGGEKNSGGKGGGEAVFH